MKVVIWMFTVLIVHVITFDIVSQFSELIFTNCISMSVSILFFKLTDLWPRSYARAWVTIMARIITWEWDWNWKSRRGLFDLDPRPRTIFEFWLCWFVYDLTVVDGSIWKDVSLSSWSPFTRLNSDLIRSRFISRQTSSVQHKVWKVINSVPNS